MSSERYLNPNVIAQVARLDLRAKFIVEGFLSGLHSSPFQGFSVEFSEHRKYSPGDDLKDLDWNVYAKTDRYYVRKYQAETNLTGYLVMDLSASMDWCGIREMEKAGVGGGSSLKGGAGRAETERLTKFEYCICLAAALGYLMIHQQDPVGLVTIGDKIKDVLPPKSKRTQLGNMLAMLSNLRPQGQTDLAHGLQQLAALIRTKSLVMVFSDFLTDPGPVMKSLYQLRHRGNEIILFHVLDEAEVEFPFEGLVGLAFQALDQEVGENALFEIGVFDGALVLLATEERRDAAGWRWQLGSRSAREELAEVSLSRIIAAGIDDQQLRRGLAAFQL